MYGHAVKCKEQLDADNRFLDKCDQEFKNRKEASDYYTTRGWDYFRKDSIELATKRFNQGWLLDSANAGPYWGFAAIAGQQKDYELSISYFDRAHQYDSTNAELCNDAVISLGQRFFEINNTAYLRKAIGYLMTATRYHPNDSRTYASLVKCYINLPQKDSAQKYLTIVDKLDPEMIAPEIRQELFH
ncbi:MAG: hypothetical protein EOP56_05880 [Sphingobacteriales bacterium]|nr:MAG: hypothetical protein EOP56_05880 [Sphingobacteriales bacterium]